MIWETIGEICVVIIVFGGLGICAIIGMVHLIEQTILMFRKNTKEKRRIELLKELQELDKEIIK